MSSVMDDQLKVLMDYTKFHIGLYTALCTLLVAVIGLEGQRNTYSLVVRCLMISTFVCFALAGVFGGLVGSSIPRFTSWTEFEKARLAPKYLDLILPNEYKLPALWAASLEHAAFWIGTIIALCGVIIISLRRPVSTLSFPPIKNSSNALPNPERNSTTNELSNLKDG